MATMLEMIGQAAIPVIKNKEEKLCDIIAWYFGSKELSAQFAEGFQLARRPAPFSRRRDRLITHSFDTDNRLAENFVASAACY